MEPNNVQTLRVRVDPRVIAIKEYSTFPKTLEVECLNQMV